MGPRYYSLSRMVCFISSYVYKKLYSQDPLFENVKVIYSLFENTFKGVLSNNIKLLFEKSDKKMLLVIKPTIGNLHKFAIDYSDASNSPNINNSVIDYAKSTGKDFCEYPALTIILMAYEELYDKILDKKKQTLETVAI